MQNLANNAQVISDSLQYWESEKLKTLQRGTAKSQQFHPKLAGVIRRLLPYWERQKRKRLGQVQIAMNS